MDKQPPIDIVAFDEPLEAAIDPTALLGGKGAGLAEMTRGLHLPVPPGFTITTAVCREYLASGWPERLSGRIAEHLERLGDRLGSRFGDPSAPLLVSVRSGAPVSMPGMMDTLLNVGITPAIRERLAATTGNVTFAADVWLRFCRMYAEVVLGMPKAAIDGEAITDASAGGLLAAAERVSHLAAAHGGIPADPFEQLRGAIAAVFDSWNSERARVFRAREGIAEDLGTAVTVQAMVFGNLDHRSGTGVAFTRDPATGDSRPFGDYLVRAQGEDVVAGTHAVRGLDALRQQLPRVHAQLMEILHTLERHYRDMCDVEFTVSEGRLYVLQTRIGRRSPLAAVRIAVAMAEDPGFPLAPAEAIARIDQGILQQLAALGRVDPAATPLATGLAASPGVGVGVLCCDPGRAAELAAQGTPVVLAREETSPSDIHGMVAAAGLLTTLGGVASHAAVVARSWAIPAITSLTGAALRPGGLLVGGRLIAEGDTVTVDGTAGALYLGDRRQPGSVDVPEVRTLREWATEAGLEPGAPVAAATDTGVRADLTLIEVARTIQLKGLCTAERAAAALSASPEAIEELCGADSTLFRTTARGFALTVEGRSWLMAGLAEERATLDARALGACYARFLPLNERFKRLVSEWQASSASGDSGTAWLAVLESLTALHDDVLPLVDDTAHHVRRLRPYGARFSRALAELRAGDTSMLASPLKDSYHTVWFEYHEELIALCGRDRATEERAAGPGP